MAAQTLASFFAPQVVEFKIGSRWINKTSGEEYILARVSRDSVALIGLKHGNRWHDPETVQLSGDLLVVSEYVARTIFSDNFDKWELVS